MKLHHDMREMLFHEELNFFNLQRYYPMYSYLFFTCDKDHANVLMKQCHSIENFIFLKNLGINIYHKDAYRRNLLFHVKNKKVLSFIMEEHDFNVNETDIQGKNLLNYHVQDEDMLLFFIKRGVKIIDERNIMNSILIDSRLSCEFIKKIVLENKLDLNIEDEIGNTILFHCKDKKRCELLYCLGADLVHENVYKQTPIFYSCHETEKFYRGYVNLDKRDKFGFRYCDYRKIV